MSNEMTAVEYLRTKARMTRAIPNNTCRIGCNQCGLASEKRSHGELACDNFEALYPEEAVAIVQKWAEEHPIKTRQSEFLKIFPGVKMTNGYIDLCPMRLDTGISGLCVSSKSCDECRKDFWLTELPEEVEEKDD